SAIMRLPPVEGATPEAQPGHESSPRQLGLRRPLGYEIHDLIPDIVGNPTAAQGSPLDFFSATYSAEISAMTLSFLTSVASSAWTLSSSAFSRPLAAGSARPASRAAAALSNSLRCQS